MSLCKIVAILIPLLAVAISLTRTSSWCPLTLRVVLPNNVSVRLSIKSIDPSPTPPSDPNQPIRIAISSFAYYDAWASDIIARKRDRFNKLSPPHRVLADAIGYSSHFETARGAVKVNTEFCQLVAAHGREVYGEEVKEDAEEKDVDPSLVSTSIGLLLRDWSEEGSAERAHIFPPILDALDRELAGVQGEKQKILLPGFGLGRLAHEIASRHDKYSVDACELDYVAILTYHYLLNHTTTALQHTLYPFTTSWTHQLNPTARFQPVRFPDTLPSSNVRLIEGDFLTAFLNADETYDAVVTLFFIDVSENVIDFLEMIKRILKPGGLWINLGPFKWGGHSKMQLSAEEVLHLADLLGFDVDHSSRRSIDSVYARQPESLLKFTYVTQFWTAKKRVTL